MIQAVLFDLDGVVVDTARFHYMAWKRLADELGIRFTEEDNERLKGVSRMDSLDILLDIGTHQGVLRIYNPFDKEELAARKNKWYVEYIHGMTPADVLPGVTDFIGQIRAAGLKTALGSASRNTQLIVERLQIGGLFDAVVDGTMVIHAKPDPEAFLLCAQMLQVQEMSACVVFEDAVAGIQAARTAGMHAIGIGKPEVLEPAGAEQVYPGFEGITWEEINRKL